VDSSTWEDRGELCIVHHTRRDSSEPVIFKSKYERPGGLNHCNVNLESNYQSTTLKSRAINHVGSKLLPSEGMYLLIIITITIILFIF
jgi:hypothetical protein